MRVNEPCASFASAGWPSPAIELADLKFNPEIVAAWLSPVVHAASLRSRPLLRSKAQSFVPVVARRFSMR